MIVDLFSGINGTTKNDDKKKVKVGSQVHQKSLYYFCTTLKSTLLHWCQVGKATRDLYAFNNNTILPLFFLLLFWEVFSGHKIWEDEKIPLKPTFSFNSGNGGFKLATFLRRRQTTLLPMRQTVGEAFSRHTHFYLQKSENKLHSRRPFTQAFSPMFC